RSRALSGEGSPVDHSPLLNVSARLRDFAETSPHSGIRPTQADSVPIEIICWSRNSHGADKSKSRLAGHYLERGFTQITGAAVSRRPIARYGHGPQWPTCVCSYDSC